MSKEKFLRRVKTGEVNVEYNDWESVEDDASQVEENDSAIDEQRSLPKETRRKMLRLIQRYQSEFQLYCSTLVVIGFNSGKYDLNLIKQKLPKYLDLQTKSGANFVIKKK